MKKILNKNFNLKTKGKKNTTVFPIPHFLKEHRAIRIYIFQKSGLCYAVPGNALRKASVMHGGIRGRQEKYTEGIETHWNHQCKRIYHKVEPFGQLSMASQPQPAT